MIDQLIIGDTASYDDYEASVKERKIYAPKKKSIKDAVPFSNETYDFSSINGEIYWEERTLEYIFEITANTPEELEEMKQGFVSWVMNAEKAELHDPFIPDYHFLATFSEIDFDDSEIEKSTITVKFTAYPYKISDAKKSCVFRLTKATEIVTTISNGSSHRITPTFISEVPFNLKMGNSSYGIPAGETKHSSIMFVPGGNKVSLQSLEGSGTLKIEFHEEVF